MDSGIWNLCIGTTEGSDIPAHLYLMRWDENRLACLIYDSIFGPNFLSLNSRLQRNWKAERGRKQAYHSRQQLLSQSVSLLSRVFRLDSTDFPRLLFRPPSNTHMHRVISSLISYHTMSAAPSSHGSRLLVWEKAKAHPPSHDILKFVD